MHIFLLSVALSSAFGAIVIGSPAKILRMKTPREIAERLKWLLDQGDASIDEV